MSISLLEQRLIIDINLMSSETSMGVRMTKNLSLGVSYRIDYVNKTEKENTDKKFLTSLIMDF